MHLLYTFAKLFTIKNTSKIWGFVVDKFFEKFLKRKSGRPRKGTGRETTWNRKVSTDVGVHVGDKKYQRRR